MYILTCAVRLGLGTQRARRLPYGTVIVLEDLGPSDSSSPVRGRSTMYSFRLGLL